MSDVSVESSDESLIVEKSTGKESVHQLVSSQLLDGKTLWDRRIIRWSDWFNPILVKETRQALKSKQFGWTFLLLVVVVFAWSVLGIVSMIPNIYYASDGRWLLSGYISILIVPATIIIPQSAFRSMASELDDGTFETLSLSLLKPRHIILGKLNVAIIQLLVYLSVIAPCISMTYLLRGITFELIGYVVTCVVTTTLCLSVIAIALACFSRSRMLQIIFSLGLILLQLLVAFVVSGTLIGICASGISGSDRTIYWVILSMIITAGLFYSWLLFACASAAIGVSSENKSTPIRIPLLVIGILIPMIGLILTTTVSGFSSTSSFTLEALCITLNLLGIHWAIAGAFIVGERGFISVRAKRKLPRMFTSRVLTSWLIPGAGTGYVFVVLSYFGAAISFIAFSLLFPSSNKNFVFAINACSIGLYLAFYLGIGRLFSMMAYRRMGAGRIVATFATVIITNIFIVLLTCMLSLAEQDYTRMDYEWYCFLNPWWTLGEMFPNSYSQGRFFGFEFLALLIVSAPVFVVNLLLASRGIVVQRIETPPRVEKEKGNKSFASVAESQPTIDPLA